MVQANLQDPFELTGLVYAQPPVGPRGAQGTRGANLVWRRKEECPRADQTAKAGAERAEGTLAVPGPHCPPPAQLKVGPST